MSHYEVPKPYTPLPEVSEADRLEHEANKDPDRKFAEQIFFHVLLRGGEGNPFTKIRNEWFIELAAPKIAELLAEWRSRLQEARSGSK